MFTKIARFLSVVLMLAFVAGILGVNTSKPVNAKSLQASISPTIISSFTVPGDQVSGLAWGNGSLWLADASNNLYQLNDSGVVQNTYPITVNTSDLSWFEDHLWAHDGSKVYQLGAAGQITNTLNVGYWSYSGMEWAEGFLYVNDYNSSRVHKHNPLGDHILSWGTTGMWGHPEGMAYDGKGLWIGDSCEGENKLYQYSLYGDVLRYINLSDVGISCNYQSHRALAWDGTYLWYGDKFTVYKLDISVKNVYLPLVLRIDPTPVVTYHWSGATNSGYPVSFYSTSDDANWNNFMMTAGFSFSGCSGTIDITFYGPGAITNNQFGADDGTLSFAGQFTSPKNASGTYNINNYNIPGCGIVNQSGSWLASRP